MRTSRRLLTSSAVLLLLVGGCSTEPPAVAISADGVEISFSSQGNGEPALVLVHGWTNSRMIWDQQIPVFSEKYQVVAVDLAGHGASGDNRTQWTMAAFGEDVAAVVRTLGLERVVLVGFSMGGPVVLEAAKLLPDQVQGVILVDAIHDPEQQYPPEMVQVADSTLMDLVEDPTVDKLMAGGFFVNDPGEAFQKIVSMLDRPADGWNASLIDLFRWSNEDCIGSLDALRVPLVVINTDAQPTAADAFRNHVPSFQLKTITGSGHAVMWDATDRFNRLLEESVQEILASGA